MRRQALLGVFPQGGIGASFDTSRDEEDIESVPLRLLDAVFHTGRAVREAIVIGREFPAMPFLELLPPGDDCERDDDGQQEDGDTHRGDDDRTIN